MGKRLMLVSCIMLLVVLWQQERQRANRATRKAARLQRDAQAWRDYQAVQQRIERDLQLHARWLDEAYPLPEPTDHERGWLKQCMVDDSLNYALMNDEFEQWKRKNNHE